MAQVRKRRNRGPARTGRRQTALTNAASPVIADECKPVRGIKLKTVSVLTMLFALACLAAFMAGRPPISAAGPVQRRDLALKAGNEGSLRNDDAGSFLPGRRRQRKAGAQKIEKGAGARAPIRALLADSKKKDQ